MNLFDLTLLEVAKVIFWLSVAEIFLAITCSIISSSYVLTKNKIAYINAMTKE